MKQRFFAMITMISLLLTISDGITAPASAENANAASSAVSSEDKGVLGRQDSGLPAAAAARQAPEALANFITRKGDALMDGENEFRFISYNVPALTARVFNGKSSVTEYEQEDAIRTIAQMGGQALRVYVFSVKGGTANRNNASHVNTPGDYSEYLFQDFDRMLRLCNKYGIRVIVPFIDNYPHHGGINEFAAFQGKTLTAFYTNPQIKQDFKALISYVLNRTNTYTGVKYKDDKAILAWELGNELAYSPDDWMSEMAAYIKSEDPNHLVMDGQYKNDGKIKAVSLNDPNIDICTLHYVDNIFDLRKQSKGKKPFVLGEFFVGKSEILPLLDDIVNSGTTGALIWSLRSHRDTGGYYFVNDFEDRSDSFQWPGFDSTLPEGEPYIMKTMREYAYKIRGLDVPPMPVPNAPYLLPIASSDAIRWKGSVGGYTYAVERAKRKTGPWSVIASDVFDSTKPYKPFNDTSAKPGQQYYYRVIAKNVDGAESSPSNVAGVVAGITAPTSASAAGTNWYEPYVSDVLSKGIMSGYEDGTFRPQGQLTRAEFAAAMAKYLNLGLPMEGAAFSDTQNHWAKNYIAALTARRIIAGNGDGNFCPDDAITREQIAVILVRAVKTNAVPNGFIFVDDSNISDWAKSAVYTVRIAGWMGGDESGFRPKDTATRGEIAAVLSRLSSYRF